MTLAADYSIEEHAAHRDRMLEHARKMLAEGDRRTLKEIGVAVERAERFLSLLHEAHLAMPPDLPMPNHPEYRKRVRQDARRAAGARTEDR